MGIDDAGREHKLGPAQEIIAQTGCGLSTAAKW